MTPASIPSIHRKLKQYFEQTQSPVAHFMKVRTLDPFRVLVATILSARTKDQTTTLATERLFKEVQTLDALGKLPLKKLETLIFPVGFYRTKARRIRDISRDLLERFNGAVPSTIEELLTLKGVGRKTANLVLTEGFHQPAMCVDTHVHRISNRLGYVRTTSPEKTEQALRAKLPAAFWGDYNALLVLWGQNVCRPVSPKCSECPVRGLCARAGVKGSR